MKYKLIVDYRARFHKDDTHECCRARYWGIFSSNALPRMGETITIPNILINNSWCAATVRNVSHQSSTKGVFHQRVECDVYEDLGNRVPTQADMDRLKEAFGDKIIPAAEKFGLTVSDLHFREEAVKGSKAVT